MIKRVILQNKQKKKKQKEENEDEENPCTRMVHAKQKIKMLTKYTATKVAHESLDICKCTTKLNCIS